ncbi:hypothetical protein ACWGOE_04175 [Leucobacter chromiiresistens]
MDFVTAFSLTGGLVLLLSATLIVFRARRAEVAAEAELFESLLQLSETAAELAGKNTQSATKCDYLQHNVYFSFSVDSVTLIGYRDKPGFFGLPYKAVGKHEPLHSDSSVSIGGAFSRIISSQTWDLPEVAWPAFKSGEGRPGPVVEDWLNPSQSRPSIAA